MKRIVLLFAAAALVLSAGAQTRKKAVRKTAKVSYTINGTVEGIADGTKLYLGVPNRSGFEKGDSSTVKDGKFSMTFVMGNSVKDVSIAEVNGKKYKEHASLLLEKANITVNIPKDGKAIVTGGNENRVMNEYKAIDVKYDGKIRPLYYIAIDTTKTRDERVKARDEVEKLQMEQFKEVADVIKTNVPSGASSLLLRYYSSAFEDATLDGILAVMKAKCPTDPVYLQFKKQRDLDAKVAVGKKYVDIALNSPEGKLVKVSNFVGKNKLVLIDFWASWCGPCRAEMPNVVKAYKEFKDKGFAVVGVSLDNNAEAWKKAIKDLEIPWAQMSDLKGWKCAGAALYNVHSIPATVLIDQSGTIIAKNLRGEELAAKLKEILK
jgi:peroxiredoxin